MTTVRLVLTQHDYGRIYLTTVLQNDDPDLRGNAASPTGPEGTSRVPADDPKL
jgi:hypothetical protein